MQMNDNSWVCFTEEIYKFVKQEQTLGVECKHEFRYIDTVDKSGGQSAALACNKCREMRKKWEET